MNTIYAARIQAHAEGMTATATEHPDQSTVLLSIADSSSNGVCFTGSAEEIGDLLHRIPEAVRELSDEMEIRKAIEAQTSTRVAAW